MALVMPLLQDSPAFDGMAVEDQVDIFSRVGPGIGTAVISGCQVTQIVGGGMFVQISSGTVSIQGNIYVYAGTGGSALPISAASAGDRRDTVVLRLVNAATPYVTAVVVQGTVPSGLVGAWTRNTLPSTALPPVKGPMNWSTSTLVYSSVNLMSDVVLGEVYVAFNTASIIGTAASILAPTTGNLVDKSSGLIYVGSASFESLVRANTPNQLAPATGAILQTTQVFTSNGTWSPGNIGANLYVATLVGGGGGGGAANATTSGAGGGGGEVLFDWYLGSVTTNQTITVGQGGGGGATSGTGGGNGTSTSIGALVTANFGTAGGGASFALQGIGGDGSTVSQTGGTGGASATTSGTGGKGGTGYGRFGMGGGGGGGPTSGGGGAGGSSQGGAGGTGAALGGGGGGAFGAAGQGGSGGVGGNGANAVDGSGGGGGGGGAGTAFGHGGKGANGQVIIKQVA